MGKVDLQFGFARFDNTVAQHKSSWIEKLVENLNSKKVPYGLRLFHHPLTGASEGSILSKIDKSLCRLVLLEGYITPPEFMSDIDVPFRSGFSQS